jgi:major membrane immunogen (membrane-anchored lipoprotein)
LKKSCLIVLTTLFLFTALFTLAGCGKTITSLALHDGYYTAEMTDYDDHGWREFVSIHVNNSRIDTVEYNARNASGFIKSWDPEYMRLMNAIDGTYPNEYTRFYATALLASQDPDSIDAISGATNSYHTFILLAEAVLEQARAGIKQVAFITASPPAGEQ